MQKSGKAQKKWKKEKRRKFSAKSGRDGNPGQLFLQLTYGKVTINERSRNKCQEITAMGCRSMQVKPSSII